MSNEQEEAVQALRDVQQVARETRGKVKYRASGPILILWGVIWVACFLVAQFVGIRAIGWAWLVGDTIGIAGTICLARMAKRFGLVLSESARSAKRKKLWLATALSVYSGVWLAVFCPCTPDQVSVFIVAVVMFLWVAIGITMDKPFFTVLGLVVTALVLAGYFGGPAMGCAGYLNLWLAITGGGALLASGVYMLLRWR